MSRHRIDAIVSDATFKELQSDPRFSELRSVVEILDNPYQKCRDVLEVIHRMCSEHNRETFTRREILGACAYSDYDLFDTKVDGQLRRLVDELDIRRVRHGLYDADLCIYPENVEEAPPHTLDAVAVYHPTAS